MNLVLIKIGSPEWELMWKWVEEHPLNKDLEDPSTALNEGEAWQYMGSYQLDERIIHTFRHRNHPRTNRVQNISLQGTNKLDNNQIEKTFKKR